MPGDFETVLYEIAAAIGLAERDLAGEGHEHRRRWRFISKYLPYQHVSAGRRYHACQFAQIDDSRHCTRSR